MSTNLVGEFKQGYKTTEFWLSVVTAGIPIGAWIAKALGYEVDTEELAAAMTGAIPGLVYIFNRGWLKRRRIEGVIATTPAPQTNGFDGTYEPRDESEPTSEPDPGQLDALDDADEGV